MCLLLVAWKLHPRHDLVLAANRDELHDRATGPLDFWPDLPGVAAGRDLAAAGTWLAVHRDGRFAAVTNYRGDQTPAAGGRSRGELVTRFLAARDSPEQHVGQLAARAAGYAGFNLLLGDGEELWYASNRLPGFARRLQPGIYGLSNHLLDTPWPKVTTGIVAMRAHVDAGREDVAALFETLSRQQDDAAAAGDLPWPASSGPFIAHEEFGTRASTIVCREPGAAMTLEERRFGPLGRPLGVTRLSLPLAGAPA